MAFDYDETNPLGTTYLADYPANEQAHRAAVLNSGTVDHYPEAGPVDAQSGFHRQLSLPPLGAKPATVGDAGFVYTKDVAGITELFYEDEDGSEVQLTSDGTASPDKLPLAGGELTGDLTMTSADLLMEGTSLVKLLNAKYIQGRDTGDAQWRDLIGVNSSDEVEIGDALLSADARAYVTDVDGLLVNYGAVDKIVWNKGHFALPPIATQIYESTPEAIDATTEGGVTHGIAGGTPPLWFAVLQCTDTDQGYSTGDEIPVMHAIMDGASTAQGFTVNSTTTRFEWRKSNSGPNTLNDGGGGSSNLDETKWKIAFRAWY